jgi:2,5-dioxopentanoate dehydrogenase
MNQLDASPEQIEAAVQEAWKAFYVYRKYSLQQRAEFMRAIAGGLVEIADELIQTAMEETHLPDARLRGELTRTSFQLTSYAEACEKGEWLEARIDPGVSTRTPPKPDLRKMLVPLGPVVVFGASNFPFAYSTAGGDTACAFAAGCPVIVKAHPAHPKTSERVALVINSAAQKSGMPAGIFAHLHGSGFETGKQLVLHPHVKAVGFTGSFAGGKALYDLANGRKEPIPVFAEMGSINPVFLMPDKLKSAATDMAGLYSASVTLSVGQFCTKPGLIIGMDGEDLDQFIHALGKQVQQVAPAAMLHPGIAKSFKEKRALALAQKEVTTLAVSEVIPSAVTPETLMGNPLIASASAPAFLQNPVLHQEVFGPYSLLIRCKNMDEMKSVALHLEGQLTCTLMATVRDMLDHADFVDSVKNICGRFILNGVPTGVEVCLAMQHGGPFPATTDSRFTSVGADGIKRFARPLSFQNWPDELLPEELKNQNPLGIWRTVNNQLTKNPVA